MKKAKTIDRWQSQPTSETQLKPQDNSELFLALAWQKQLNINTQNQGTLATQLHNKNGGNFTQSTIDKK